MKEQCGLLKEAIDTHQGVDKTQSADKLESRLASLSNLYQVPAMKDTLASQNINAAIVKVAHGYTPHKHNFPVISATIDAFEKMVVNRQETPQMSRQECKNEMIDFANDVLSKGWSELPQVAGIVHSLRQVFE